MFSEAGHLIQVQQGSAHKKKKYKQGSVFWMDVYFLQQRHFFKNIIFLKTHKVRVEDTILHQLFNFAVTFLRRKAELVIVVIG